MLAGIGIGLYKNIDDAYEQVKKPGKTYKPDIELTKKYNSLYKIYKRLYPSLKSVSHDIFDTFKSS